MSKSILDYSVPKDLFDKIGLVDEEKRKAQNVPMFLKAFYLKQAENDQAVVKRIKEILDFSNIPYIYDSVMGLVFHILYDNLPAGEAKIRIFRNRGTFRRGNEGGFIIEFDNFTRKLIYGRIFHSVCNMFDAETLTTIDLEEHYGIDPEEYEEEIIEVQ